MVSPAYILSEFCAKEFWLFDSRRQEAAGTRPPARVLLPIIWVPADPLPPAIAAAQFNHASLPGDYTTLGLRRLMRQGRWRAYRECIDVFAEEILKAGRAPFIPPKTLPLPSFGEMPLAFEPAGSRARFVFMAAKRSEFAATARADRYSDNGNAWMPFNPPVPNTVQDISSTAAYEQNMAYGELPADHSLSNTLQNARARDRVVLVVDPWTLCLDAYRSRIPPRDVLDSRRAAVIVPFPDAGNASAADRASVERALADAFPQADASARAPYEQTDSIESFRSAIARGLAATHLNAINAAAEQQRRWRQDPDPRRGPGLSRRPRRAAIRRYTAKLATPDITSANPITDNSRLFIT
jgi:FxsC-like protein